VIVAAADVVTKAAKDVTSTIPIVMAGTSIPVELGVVKGLQGRAGTLRALQSRSYSASALNCLKTLYRA
jgi:hypothetical protein